MENNFNSFNECSASSKLNQVHEQNLKNEESLKKRHEVISKLDINPEFSWPLNDMLDEINASLFEIMECKSDILAENEIYNKDIIDINDRHRRVRWLTSMRAANDDNFSAAA